MYIIYLYVYVYSFIHLCLFIHYNNTCILSVMEWFYYGMFFYVFRLIYSRQQYVCVSYLLWSDFITCISLWCYLTMCMLLSATSTYFKWEVMLYCVYCPILNKVFLLLLLLEFDPNCWIVLEIPGLYSLSGKTSYRQVSWSLEATRLDVMIIVSPWNLTGISAALLPMCLSNFRAIGKNLNPNLAASRLRNILRQAVHPLSE